MQKKSRKQELHSQNNGSLKMAFFLYKCNGAIFIFIIIQSNIYYNSIIILQNFPKTYTVQDPSICHISAAECHEITNYGSKFSGERGLTEYSKIKCVLFMYKKSLNTLPLYKGSLVDFILNPCLKRRSSMMTDKVTNILLNQSKSMTFDLSGYFLNKLNHDFFSTRDSFIKTFTTTCKNILHVQYKCGTKICIHVFQSNKYLVNITTLKIIKH